MTQITLEDAQRRLSEVIATGVPGEAIEIVQNQQVVAKLVPIAAAKPRPRFGSAQGSILYMADDFDAPLEEFKEYME